MADTPLSGWALILGASSGFGEAAALALAEAGMDIFGVHLDRKATMHNVERITGAIENAGRRARFFNINAADPDKRKTAAARMRETLDESGQAGEVRVLFHSLAFGTLKPLVGEEEGESVTPSQMDMTLDVMAHSLVYWTQELVWSGLMTDGGKIFAMTSSGGGRVMDSYGAVSAAKAALESHIRQLTLELRPKGICANALRAGVTDTPALRKIPGHGEYLEKAAGNNPGRRLTEPEDVARALVRLSMPGTEWITGNVIGVDGGEDIVA
ncbi:MAG: SDR family oxidoreductase [bacterium]